LLDEPGSDAEVRAARHALSKIGWAAEMLAKQNPEGWWAGKERFYGPKYVSSNWMLLILADLGLTKANPRIAKACESWIKRFAKKDGGFGADNWKASHLCITGNTARALVQFGYVDHPKVQSAFEWMVENRAAKGGWSCYGSGRNLDSWEPMSAFAVYPSQKWTRAMKQAVESGAEFFLERELHKQGPHYPPWYRFHYPIHYYYDLLVGLDFMTALGYGEDRRLKHALGMLKKKRRGDGRWDLDNFHPDVGRNTAEWYAKHKITPFVLEIVGMPSKMITLTAMRVLKRVNGDV
jgi:hypothetical protein